MKNTLYLLAKTISKIKKEKNQETIIRYFEKKGIKIGKNCKIYSNIVTPESFLIELGDNVTIASEVTFITHDNSIIKVLDNKTDLFGKIAIGNNCFIGAHTLMMYGVTLTNNIIVAAGSVVTKSFNEENIIIGGNPARKIATWSTFAEKNINRAINVQVYDKNVLKYEILKEEHLVKR